MGGVIIAPNIKKEKVMIDLSGNEIDPVTKKVVKKKELEYIPPPPHVLEAWKNEKNPQKSSPLGEKIAQMINAKIEKIVEEKIDEALKGL